jgi:hypothetical protein
MADWSLAEVEAVVAEYFAMLGLELRGETYNKADRNRQLRRLLNSRSAGSVEFKHQNISAVLVNRNQPYIAGYKPRQNYQSLLEDVVLQRIESDADWAARALKSEVFAPTAAPPTDFSRLADLEENPPDRRERPIRRQGARVVHIDFVERETGNARLGRLGEEWTLEYERRRLHDAGRRDLSTGVRHVSVEEGDGLGYDISSFDTAGKSVLIEVKTTGLGKSFPFYVSRNELHCSKREAPRYQLYRVFEFSQNPRLFRLKGDLEKSCRLEPTTYRASW